MKITVCGSTTFRKEKVEIKDKLIELGYEPLIDFWTEKLAKEEAGELKQQINKEHSEVKRQYDFIREYYEMIKNSDAILVVNIEKNGIPNYIGANTFLEIGYAHCMNKKIYFLNPIPNQEYLADELKSMKIIILNQDLSKIL